MPVMPAAEGLLVFVLIVSAAGILLVFCLYPLLVVGLGSLRRGGDQPAAGPLPSASLLVAVRNAEALVEEKVRNALALDAPEGLEIVLVSDGSTDGTAARARAAGGGRIEVQELDQHRGKAHALNLGAERCHGEILVFSDVDALLAPDALVRLLARFAEARVGGVCGQRVIAERGGELDLAQQ